ncbi:SH3 domain-containing protein [Puniceibacterium confluentis]|uniref:SH3 domain-containing protein n=1 Tax=Puniceibacterium confluentis TaxID=1958944 RepID=UPI003569F977
MSRFVILSFAFMGLGFYELSGGADFQPGSNTTAKALGISSAEASVPEKVARADTSSVPLTGVARARFGDGIANTKPTPGVMLATLEVPTVARQAVEPARAQAVPGAAEAEAEPATTPLAEKMPDIRKVDGSRVNVRFGPGTNYSIVTKLGRGDEVEVLQNNGEGWLKLRVVESNRIGWMADFLVTAAAE